MLSFLFRLFGSFDGARSNDGHQLSMCLPLLWGLIGDELELLNREPGVAEPIHRLSIPPRSRSTMAWGLPLAMRELGGESSLYICVLFLVIVPAIPLFRPKPNQSRSSYLDR